MVFGWCNNNRADITGMPTQIDEQARQIGAKSIDSFTIYFVDALNHGGTKRHLHLYCQLS